MRLNRRRRRSLHDLDAGSADYGDFRENVPNLTDLANDWVDALLTEADRAHRRRLREEAQRARDADSRDAVSTDLNLRYIVQPNNRDTIQANRHISDAQMHRSTTPASEYMRNAQRNMRTDFMHALLQRFPGSEDEWRYSWDISRDETNQQTNLTLTARRPLGLNGR